MPQPKHLTKLKLPLPKKAPKEEDLAKYFAKCLEKLGMVPNVIRVVAQNPNKARNFIATYNELMLGESGLSKLEREMIAVVVSAANRCYYCLVAHGQAVRQISGDPQLGEMMVMNYRVAELAPRQRAMLDFAWKLSVAPFDIGDADRAALRKVGFSDRDIYDIGDVAAFFNMTNRLAHATDMMPNPEYHAMTR
ncbi:MAG: peroxidase-related enzyme [Reyranellaceae bacterium]